MAPPAGAPRRRSRSQSPRASRHREGPRQRRRGDPEPRRVARIRQGRRLNTGLVLKSLRSGRLEGRSRLRGGVRWRVLRDAPPAAPLLRMRPLLGCLGVTVAREILCKSLRTLKTGPGLAARPEAAAWLLAVRAQAQRHAPSGKPLPQVARKFRRKPLKTLKTGPGLAPGQGSPRGSCPPLGQGGRSHAASGKPLPRVARKFRRKPLKTLKTGPGFALRPRSGRGVMRRAARARPAAPGTCN